jgi:hypothetical protein
MTVVSTGLTYRLVPQISWHAGPYAAYGEFAFTSDEANGLRVASSAWSAVATAVLTGESALPLHYVIPRHALDLRAGHPGAIEIAMGVGSLDIRDDGQLATLVDPNAAMRGARLYTGVNWYPVVNVRAMVDIEHMTST